MAAHQNKRLHLLNSDSSNNEIYHSTKHKTLYSIGQIKEVQMINFMCHKNFIIQFRPTHMQIITGANGSGKSAVANAICLCLGAHARTTGRTSNIQSFIRKGEAFAELTIVLANEGTEAYKSAIYGNEIRIVRRIGLRHSSYRIMDINHKFLSASKETIDEILQALSIMPENPLCILHQEIAKKFLLNNDSRTKYHFYMKVSQLDQIKQAYEQSLCTVQLLQQRIEIMKEKYHRMTRELEPLEQDVRKIEVRIDYEKRKHGLEVELQTARMHQAKQECVEVQQEYDQIKASKETLDKEIFDEKRTLSNIEQRMEEVCIEKADFERDIQDLEKLSKLFSQQKTYLNKQISSFNQKYETYKDKLTDIELKQINIQKQIDECEKTNSLSTNFDREYLQIDSEISSRKDQQIHYEQMLLALNNEMYICEEKIEERQTVLNLLRNQFQRKQIDRDRVNIHAIWMNDCLKTIENESKFHEKPIGPISQYIHCLSEHWSYAVEKHLAPIMSSFVCSNNDDEKLLIDILSSYSSAYRPPIYVRKYANRVHDISGTIESMRKANLVTVYDVLKIENTTVACVLIDYKQIEATILVENLDEFRQLKSNGRLQWKQIDRKVKQVAEVWTFDGANVKLDSTSRIYTNDKQPRRFFLTDQTQTLAHDEYQADIRTLEDQIQDINDELNKLNMNKQRIHDEIKQTEKQSTDNKQKIDQLMKKNDRYDASMSNISDYSFEELKEQNENLKQLHTDTVNEYDCIKEKHDKNVKELADVEQHIDNIISKIDLKTKQYDLLIEKLTIEQNQRSECLEKNNRLTNKIRQLTAIIQQYENRIKELSKTLTKKSKKSNANIRSIQEIRNELDGINHYLDENRDTNEVRRNVIEQYRIKRDQTRDYKQLYERCSHQVNYLKQFVDKRKDNFLTIADQHRYLLRWKFQNLMKKYSFDDCDIEIDHKKEQLNIIINNQGEQTTALLSGGEKSISTFCFLLALWESIYQPFRLLDEIDIYMDNERTNSMLNHLYENTSKYSSIQHIILTPQAIDAHFWNQFDIPVFQMSTPKRSFT